MAEQKWFKKASVQASIVHAIPSLVLVITALITLIMNNRNYNRQLDFIGKQYARDSILDESQIRINKTRLKTAAWGILNDMPYGSNEQIYKQVVTLSSEEKGYILNSIINKSVAEIDNPILVDNDFFRQKWENNIFQSRMIRRMGLYGNNDFSGFLFNISEDLFDIISELSFDTRRIKVNNDSMIFINVKTGDTLK